MKNPFKDHYIKQAKEIYHYFFEEIQKRFDVVDSDMAELEKSFSKRMRKHNKLQAESFDTVFDRLTELSDRVGVLEYAEPEKKYKYKGRYMVAYSGPGTIKEIHIYPNIFKTKEATKTFMLERKKETGSGVLFAYKVDLALEYETD